MAVSLSWTAVLDGLRERGWRARVVAAERLDDVCVQVARAVAGGGLPEQVAAQLTDETAFTWPDELAQPRSVIVAASSRPVTQALLTIDGEQRPVVVPPHYAGYHAAPGELATAAGDALEPAGCRVASFESPLKTLAACSGLARFGRNNIIYVEGMGSYLALGACASDAAPPSDAEWGEPRALERCSDCVACLRACPTGAIDGDRFLLHTERCLTYHNESEAPFPDWIEPGWHHVAVGCLRCQQVCPENAGIDLVVAAPERFDEHETSAILAAEDESRLEPGTREKLERCGLDYSSALIARNLTALLGSHG